MGLLILLPYYVRWYYGKAPRNIIFLAEDIVWFLWRFFSIDLYARRHRNFAGFMIWLLCAIFGLVSVAVAIVVAAIVFVLWYVMPLIMTLILCLAIIFLARP